MKFIFGILLLINFTNSQKTFCDCDGEPLSVDSAYKLASHIFVGEVVAIKSSNKSKYKDYPFGYNLITIDSMELIKGEVGKTIKIATENSSCRIPLVIGRKYLVVAYYDSVLKLPVVHQCLFDCPDIRTNDGEKLLLRMKDLSK